MLSIKKLTEMIKEELNDAEKYARCALDAKEQGKTSLAATFNKLSLEEMGHMEALHDQVENIISEYRKEHGDPPERMLGRYEYAHEEVL